MAETLSAVWGHSASDTSDYARQVPYASLALSMDGNTSLVIMAYQGGKNGERTLWQAQDRATLELRHGAPFASAGFDNELMGIHYSANAATVHWHEAETMTVHWRDNQGRLHANSGNVTTHCRPAEPLALPLTTRPLEACHQRVNWQHAGTSDNTLWQDPHTGRIWAGDIEPWPGAQRISWQVARPWWPQN